MSGPYPRTTDIAVNRIVSLFVVDIFEHFVEFFSFMSLSISCYSCGRWGDCRGPYR